MGKTPVRHTVRTRHPRYKVPQYDRGKGTPPASPPYREVRGIGGDFSGTYMPSDRPRTEGEMPTPVDNLVDQLRSMDRWFRVRYNIRELIRVDYNTLRLAVRGRGNALNVDIRHDQGRDSYDVTAYEIKPDLSVWKVYHIDDIYTEGLPDTLDRAIRDKKWSKNPERVG